MFIHILLKKNKLGALTNKPYAFQNRPWDLEYIISTDAYDSLGSNIRIDLYGSEIKRILPLKNDIINEDWISNRTRFLFEAFFKWRVNVPFIKKKNKLIQSSWLKCFFFFFLNLWYYSYFFNANYIGFFLDLEFDIELLIILKLFNIILGFFVLTINNLNLTEYYLYYLNPNFYKDLIEKKIFIFLGINLRLEAPILNIKLKKKKIKDYLIYGNIGNLFNDNLNSFNLGINIKKLVFLLKGKLPFNIFLLKKIKNLKLNMLDIKNNNNIMLIVGNNINIQIDNKLIYMYILKNIKNLELFNILNNSKFFIYNYSIDLINNIWINKLNLKNLMIKSNIIYLNLFKLLYQEINIEYINKIKKWWNLNILYLLNQKNLIKNIKNKFLIFQGHHIDLNTLNVNIIFPNKIIFEKENYFLNQEGHLLKVNKATSVSGLSKNDWMILNALYLYSLKIYNKIYNLNLYKKKLENIKFNHYYWYIDNKKFIYKFIKQYTINFYFKNLSYLLNNKINFALKYLDNLKVITKIYNKIIENYYYNIYDIYLMDKYSRTFKFLSENYDFYSRNYSIKKKKKKN